MTDLERLVQTTIGDQSIRQAALPAVDNTETQESDFVNLTIKVHRGQRLHWLIEAKKQGTSLTAAITDALNKRFGASD